MYRLRIASFFCLLGVGVSIPLTALSNGTSLGKQFTLNLTWENFSPDGVMRKMILTNGQFPGPTLFIDQGDQVEVTVNNFMPFNTTVHFHGI